MDFDLMISSFPKLLGATVITLKLLSASLFFGIFVGLFFAILRLNKNKKLLDVGSSGLWVYWRFQEKDIPTHSSSYFIFEFILLYLILSFLSNVVDEVKDQNSLILWLYEIEYWFLPSISVVPFSSNITGEWILLIDSWFSRSDAKERAWALQMDQWALLWVPWN